LAELIFAADRSYMLLGQMQGDNRPAAKLELTRANFGAYPMSHGLTRLQSRFLAALGKTEALQKEIGRELAADEADDAEETQPALFAHPGSVWRRNLDEFGRAMMRVRNNGALNAEDVTLHDLKSDAPTNSWKRKKRFRTQTSSRTVTTITIIERVGWLPFG
jgi:hypothetical protein